MNLLKGIVLRKTLPILVGLMSAIDVMDSLARGSA